MQRKVSDLIAEFFEKKGVQHAFGIIGSAEKREGAPRRICYIRLCQRCAGRQNRNFVMPPKRTSRRCEESVMHGVAAWTACLRLTRDNPIGSIRARPCEMT